MFTLPPAIAKPCLFLIAFWPLGACTPSNQAPALWDDYQSRLERVLSSEVTGISNEIPQFSMPTRMALPETASIGLLDLTRLNHCRLGNLIATHNSSLGKLAAPSTRLIYHLEFIRTAPECITTLDDAELADTLEKELILKKQRASALYVWFLENDPIIRKRLFVGASSLKADMGIAGLNQTLAAFSSLMLVKDQIDKGEFEQIDTGAIETALYELNRNDFIGGYMAGMKMHLKALPAINAYLSGQPGMRCSPGYNPAKQEILLNVLNKAFLGRLQPYLGLYSETQFVMESTMVSLFAGSQWQGQIEYYFDETGAMTSLKEEIRAHIAVWQALQQSCALEIKPGTAGRRPG